MVSRVAKNPVVIPDGVEVQLANQTLTVKGKAGELVRELHSHVTVTQQDTSIVLSPANNSRSANALAGTMRALVSNMVKGVSELWEAKLELKGVGYRGKAQGNKLNLTLGLSHPVDMEMPKGITVETPTQTEVVIKGVDKQQVKQIAANIRNLRPPEPYKGKGIRYVGEQIILKEVKKK